MKQTGSDKFNFFVPFTLQKGGKVETKDGYRISGICSSKTEDSDEEILDPSGFDFSELISSGYFNWNHQSIKEPGAILGRPTAAKVINNGNDLFVEGFLYKGVQKSKDIIDLANTLEQEDPERKLGFSIEGFATQRDLLNPKKVKKAKITGIAITHCPKNSNTFLSIMKGEYSEPFIVEKSMNVDLNLTKESIDGTHGLLKSDIYESIFEKYPNISIEDSKGVYKLIKSIQNQTNMSTINSDIIKKAFDLLDKTSGVEQTKDKQKEEKQQTATSQLKSREEKEKEDVEQFIKSCLMENKNKPSKEIEDEIIQKGYSIEVHKPTLERLLKEFQDGKDGGEITESSNDKITKSLEIQLEKINSLTESTNSLVKSQFHESETKFGAIADILKVNTEDIGDLQKSLDSVIEKLNSFSKQTNQRKSLGSSLPIERFEKSQDSNLQSFSLSNPIDRDRLTSQIFKIVENGIQKGETNMPLQRAIQDIETTRTLNDPTVLSHLKTLGIEVTR